MTKRDNRDLLYGIHAVSATLEAGDRPVQTLYILAKKNAGKKLPRSLSGIVKAAEAKKVPVICLSAGEFKQLIGDVVHQGVAAHAAPFPFVSLEDLLMPWDAARHIPFLLIADGVVDPHNLGALIRTAVCAGVDGLVIPKDNAAGPTPAVVKVSAGAVEYMRIARVTNLTRAINRLKDKGIWVAGLDRTGGKTVYEYDLTGPLALVVGGEEKGIRRLVREACDYVMAIPQAGVVESLNVSVAGGVAMYEVCRQRREKI
ncbi:MAG: 23S rRNA (guanosine(2251)-2'-O)-methyltransferase RlmB [Thermodesulfobacteriota bacterium]|nr:23S rRNA (guanosine(2251)-2'-O)-methyltransferase RlmB [Thermodesulfobacteriota bacterium]